MAAEEQEKLITPCRPSKVSAAKQKQISAPNPLDWRQSGQEHMKTEQGTERSGFHRWNNSLSPGEAREEEEEEGEEIYTE